MRPNRYFLPFFLSLLICSCLPANNEKQKVEKISLVDTTNDLQENSAGDLAIHYWDNYDFTDKNAIKNPDISEQALVDYIILLDNMDQDKRSSNIKLMLDKASVNPEVFDYFIKQYEHYLYDPNSPMRNDLYYEAVLEYLINTSYTSSIDKIRYKLRLELVRKNKLGSVITDFRYLISAGKNEHLHTQTNKDKLLVFYDPNCAHCKYIIQELSLSTKINELINNNKLEVIAIYPLDNKELWQQYQSHIPTNWINGFDTDQVIISKELYHLRAFPTIFLINKENIVVLKDPDIDSLIKFLEKKTDQFK